MSGVIETAGQAGQVMGRVSLGIQVDQQGPVAFRRAYRCQVAGNAGLAYTALLVENHSPHDTPP